MFNPARASCLLLIVSLLLAQPVSAREVPAEAKRAYDRGIALQQDQKYDDAIAVYQDALRKFPTEPTLYFALATAYQAKNAAKAAAAYEQAIKYGNEDEKREWQPYLEAARQSLAAPFFEEGAKKFQMQDYEGAINAYQNGLAIVPNYGRGWTMIGAAYEQLERWDKARLHYQKGLEADKKTEVANFYFIGILDENAGNGQMALEDYENYVLAQPEGPHADDSIARIARLKANINAVARIATDNTNPIPREAESEYQIAVKLQREGKFDKAIAHYDKAIAIKAVPAYLFGKATAHQARYAINDATEQADLDEAIALYREAIASTSPRDAALQAQYKNARDSAYQLKAAPLVESGYKKQTTELSDGKYDIVGAIADYEGALKYLPNDAGLHFALGNAYEVAGNHEKALREYTKTVALEPKMHSQVQAFANFSQTARQESPHQSHSNQAVLITNLNDGITYLRIPDLTPRLLTDHVRAMLAGARPLPKCLIIDLRNNLGGSLANCSGLPSLFLSPGHEIFSTVEVDGYKKTWSGAGNGILAGTPIFVLMNRSTYAGALIIVAALQDNGRATVVGERSYSSDLVQSLQRLDDGTAIRVSNARWLTPADQSVRRSGVTPNILIPVSAHESQRGYGPWFKVKTQFDVRDLKDKQLLECLKLARSRRMVRNLGAASSIMKLPGHPDRLFLE